ncbi:hypothetical protein CR513_31546, partial [Mucuna pruriens]
MVCQGYARYRPKFYVPLPVGQLRFQTSGIEKKETRGGKVSGQVRKLITAGFVREVQYPTWFANVVMVKKANDW